MNWILHHWWILLIVFYIVWLGYELWRAPIIEDKEME
jgi:threonine/homoserine/homoserine lactone efflux protein